MKLSVKSATVVMAAIAAASAFVCGAAAGQAVPVMDTAVPIIVGAVTHHKASPYPKIQGTVMNATIAEITVREKDNELAIQSFSLSEEAAAKMQKIIDKGGYQYGDKVTIYYDPQTRKAIKIKGKPSKPL